MLSTWSRVKTHLSVLALAGAISVSAWAGGSGFSDDDDNTAEDGPSYFGFVRDTSGRTIPDARVTVSLKNRLSVVTRTDALGTYKVPGFGNTVDSKDVVVACAKDGFRQLRVVRRSMPNADPKIPIETECTLQKL